MNSLYTPFVDPRSHYLSGDPDEGLYMPDTHIHLSILWRLAYVGMALRATGKAAEPAARELRDALGLFTGLVTPGRPGELRPRRVLFDEVQEVMVIRPDDRPRLSDLFPEEFSRAPRMITPRLSGGSKNRRDTPRGHFLKTQNSQPRKIRKRRPGGNRKQR